MNLLNRELEPNPDLVFTVVDEEAILLEQTTGKYYSLNKVGTRMWVLLAEEGRLEAVYERLLTEFDVDPAQLRRDLEKLVAQLLENGLLT